MYRPSSACSKAIPPTGSRQPLPDLAALFIARNTSFYRSPEFGLKPTPIFFYRAIYLNAPRVCGIAANAAILISGSLRSHNRRDA